MPLLDSAIDAQQEQILIHLLDNFYQHLHAGFEITIKSKAVFFPKLNLFLENAQENSFKLKKLNNEQCAIFAENFTALHTPYMNVKKSGKINIIHLANEKVGTALLASFIPLTEIKKICALKESWYDKISKSLPAILPTLELLTSFGSKNL